MIKTIIKNLLRRIKFNIFKLKNNEENILKIFIFYINKILLSIFLLYLLSLTVFFFLYKKNEKVVILLTLSLIN